MGDEIFTTIDLYRGKRLSLQNLSFIERLISGDSNNYKNTGLFRGNIDLIEDEVL